MLAEVGTIGTAPNVAIQKYLNGKQVPQLFITAGGRRFNDPKTFPWTVPLYPDFETEGRVIAKYILKTKPDARIGVLLPERRLWKGLSQRSARRARIEGLADHCGSVL